MTLIYYYPILFIEFISICSFFPTVLFFILTLLVLLILLSVYYVCIYFSPFFLYSTTFKSFFAWYRVFDIFLISISYFTIFAFTLVDLFLSFSAVGVIFGTESLYFCFLCLDFYFLSYFSEYFFII